MAAPLIVIDSIDNKNPSAHKTTPLPFSRRTQKQKPVSPGAILDKYTAIREDDVETQFPNTHPHRNLENDPKRIKARKSFNSVMLDLSSIAALAKKEHQKHKSREILEREIKTNNDEYSSDSSHSSQSSRTHSSSSSTHSSSYTNSNSQSHSVSHERPYIADSSEDSFSNHSPVQVDNQMQITGRYSTYVNKKYTKTKTTKDTMALPSNGSDQMRISNSKVSFAPVPQTDIDGSDNGQKKSTNKRGRVTFAMAPDTDDLKDNVSDSSSLTSQSDDLLNDFFDVSDNGIEPSLLDSTHSLHNDTNKPRKSKFLKFNINFLEQINTSTKPLIPNIRTSTAKDRQSIIDNTIDFSHTVSTVDFDQRLWLPVSDRSDSSDDSFTNLHRINDTHRRKTKKHKKHKIRNGNKEESKDDNLNEKDMIDEIDRFKQSILNDLDDDEAISLDDSLNENPFDLAINDDSDSDTDSYNENASVQSYNPHKQRSVQKGDRMWFTHHMGHLKVLKKFFREMDKDKDGTISFDEWTKFLSKYGVNKKFTSEEIERFFLKITTDAQFDPDEPNAVETKTTVISPTLMNHMNESENSIRKSTANKKTSIFFKKSKNAPTGEIDMPTFLFYFSSPIDSQAMNESANGNRETQVSDGLQSLQHLPEKVKTSPYAAPYHKAVAMAANKAKQKQVDRRIDTSLLFTSKGTKSGKRHSMGAKSTGRKLKKRVMKNNATKRGSISTIKQYHLQQRLSKNESALLSLQQMQSIRSDSKTITRSAADTSMSGLNAMSLLLNRDSLSKKNVSVNTDIKDRSDSAIEYGLKDRSDSAINYRMNRFEIWTREEMDDLVKLMRRNIQLQDRTHKETVYDQCFVGRDLVTWFLNKEFVKNRHSGLLLGRKLAVRGYIKYAGMGGKQKDFEDEIIFFYQFTSKELTDGDDMGFPALNDNNISFESDEKNGNRYSTMTNDTPVPTMEEIEYKQSINELAVIVNKMRTSVMDENKCNGKAMIDWWIAHNYCKNREEGIQFGGFIRKQGLIRHSEYDPIFRDKSEEMYQICDEYTFNTDDMDDEAYDSNEERKTNTHTQSVFFAPANGKKMGNDITAMGMSMGHIMEEEVHNSARKTMPITNLNSINSNASYNRRQNDSMASNFTTQSTKENTQSNTGENRHSVLLGQMGRGRATRGKKREKLVQDLFTFIISSQIHTVYGGGVDANMSSDSLYAMDLIVDGAEHVHVKRLLNKIETKFKKCDSHSRGSLGKEEFNRFLIKCGIILGTQDLNVIFKIFDKNNTGLIDYYNFSDNSVVHRVPGIKTENLTITHLLKHTISVNFGISSGKRGFDDQFTVISMAIATAFEKINSSNTGEITLDEFRLAYRKNGIEIYGGVTQIFERLCSRGKSTISLANFIDAFQGTIFANRADPPTLKEVLSKLGIIQWTLGNNFDNPPEIQLDNEDSVQTVQSNVTSVSNVGAGKSGYIAHKMLAVTPQDGVARSITPQSQISPNSRDTTNAIGMSDVRMDNSGYIVQAPGMVSPTPSQTSILMTNINGQPMRQGMGGLHEVKESQDLIIPMNIEVANGHIQALDGRNHKPQTRQKRSLTNEIQSPHMGVQVTLTWNEAFDKVWKTFFKSTIVIALPGVILNSLLHFLQAIPVNDTFPLVDLTWYIFGFLVYLALQSTMVGLGVTKSLILLDVIVAGSIGALLAIATGVGVALDSNLESLMGKGIGWWTGLFAVYLVCECAARLKYMKIFGSQRTKREMLWYAVKSAIGVTLFWMIQTMVSVIVVNVSFSSKSQNRWPIILYCAITLTLIRNVSLNSLGTAFVSKLSDRFYLEDSEMMELRIDQMLLTQLSIISSYSSLWYLFTKTKYTDWNWVICGILTYQFILLFMDISFAQKKYIRPKMVSLLKGELIAWFAVGARAIMAFLFPFGYSESQENIDSNNGWDTHIVWCITYTIGPLLLLSLLWLRIFKVWSYDNIEEYWDFDDFQFDWDVYKYVLCCQCCRCRLPRLNDENELQSPMTNSPRSERTNVTMSSATNKKQRNRLMIICALTIGFIVSVTEAVSLWSDDPNTLQYEGFINLDF